MAYVSATKYGARTDTTRYGEDLRASDGNGDMFGEQVEVRQTVENATNLRVQEIEYMLYLLTEHSLPGDDRLRALLVFDRIVLTAGVADGYKTVLEQYPDLPEHIVEVAAEVSDPQEIAHSYEDAQRFAEEPIEYLAALSRERAHEILDTLIETQAERQHAEAQAKRLFEQELVVA